MKKGNFVYYILGVFISLVMLLPFIWGVLLSFKNNVEIFNEPFGLPKRYDFYQYIATFKTGHLGNLFLNSLVVTILSVSIALVLIFFSSYSIARLTHKGKKISNFFYYLFLSATSVPAFAVLMTIYNTTLALGKVNKVLGIDSTFGLVLPYVAAQIPFLTLMFVGGLKSLPLEMEEAGIIDGCKLPDLIFRIDLPIVMPIVVTAFIFTFLGIWNEYPISSILLSSSKNFTIPLALAFFKDNYSADYGAMLRAVIMILIPQLIFFFIFQRRIIEGMATAGIKG